MSCTVVHSSNPSKSSLLHMCCGDRSECHHQLNLLHGALAGSKHYVGVGQYSQLCHRAVNAIRAGLKPTSSWRSTLMAQLAEWSQCRCHTFC
jgi:hypothetical protein